MPAEDLIQILRHENELIKLYTKQLLELYNNKWEILREIRTRHDLLLECPKCHEKNGHIFSFGLEIHCWTCRHVWTLASLVEGQ